MERVDSVELRGIPQACIIAARSPDEGLRAAVELAAAAVCTGEGQRPCGKCRGCRKVFSGVHPDVSILRRLSDDKGRQKKEISVAQVRELVSDAVVLPNEAERKVYIIDEADTMNIAAQNAALKLLEEPPAGAVFILCASNPEKLLPTVRSRCAEMGCGGAAPRDDGESLRPAKEFIRVVSGGDRAALFKWCAANEGMDTRRCADFLDCACELTADMLCGRQPDRGMSRAALMSLAELLEKCALRARLNVGVKHIFGLLAVDGIAAETEEK